MSLNKQKGNMYPWVDYTWNPIRGRCPHQCDYCLPAGTKITMKNFEYKDIKDVEIGNKVIGLNTEKEGMSKFDIGNVENISKRVANTIIIKTDKGNIECTPNHKLLGSTAARHGTDWKQAKNFSPYELLRFIEIPKKEDESHKKGWITGFIDGDGCFFETENQWGNKGKGFEAVCTDSKLTNEFINACADFDIELNIGKKVNSKKSGGGSNPLIFSRRIGEVNRLKKLHTNSIREFDREYNNKHFFEGYIAGLLDSDGSVSRTNQVRISQSKEANRVIYDRLLITLKKLGIKYTEEKTGIYLKGGFKMRSYLLFRCKPKHSVKSKRLIDGFSIKGSFKPEIKSIEIGDKKTVYNLETSLGNFVANGFIVHNCYMNHIWKMRESKGQNTTLRLVDKELKTDLGSGKRIFVGSSTDMWTVHHHLLTMVMRECMKYDNRYIFQTKNVDKMLEYLTRDLPVPLKVLFGTTIETDNRLITSELSKAPTPKKRLFGLIILKYSFNYPVFVSIEPIMDFNVKRLLVWLKQLEPEFVTIGAATGKYRGFPEPPEHKIDRLISELREHSIEVKMKKNMKRLQGER